MKGHCLMRFISPLSVTNSSGLKSIFLTLNSFLASPLSIAYSPTSSETFLFILILSSESHPSSPVSISLFLKTFFCCSAISDNLRCFSCSCLNESDCSQLVLSVDIMKKNVCYWLIVTYWPIPGVGYCFCMRYNRMFME